MTTKTTRTETMCPGRRRATPLAALSMALALALAASAACGPLEPGPGAGVCEQIELAVPGYAPITGGAVWGPGGLTAFREGESITFVAFDAQLIPGSLPGPGQTATIEGAVTATSGQVSFGSHTPDGADAVAPILLAITQRADGAFDVSGTGPVDVVEIGAEGGQMLTATISGSVTALDSEACD